MAPPLNAYELIRNTANVYIMWFFIYRRLMTMILIFASINDDNNNYNVCLMVMQMFLCMILYVTNIIQADLIRIEI